MQPEREQTVFLYIIQHVKVWGTWTSESLKQTDEEDAGSGSGSGFKSSLNKTESSYSLFIKNLILMIISSKHLIFVHFVSDSPHNIIKRNISCYFYFFTTVLKKNSLPFLSHKYENKNLIDVFSKNLVWFPPKRCGEPENVSELLNRPVHERIKTFHMLKCDELLFYFALKWNKCCLCHLWSVGQSVHLIQWVRKHVFRVFPIKTPKSAFSDVKMWQKTLCFSKSRKDPQTTGFEGFYVIEYRWTVLMSRIL